MGQQWLQGHAGAMMAIDLQSVWSLTVCALGVVPISGPEFMDRCVQGIWSLWMVESYTDPIGVYEC